MSEASAAYKVETLFPLPEPTPPSARQGEPFEAPKDPKRGARIREANRSQMVWGRIDLDAQLAEDHAARAIWAVAERLDLTDFRRRSTPMPNITLRG